MGVSYEIGALGGGNVPKVPSSASSSASSSSVSGCPPTSSGGGSRWGWVRGV